MKQEEVNSHRGIQIQHGGQTQRVFEKNSLNAGVRDEILMRYLFS